ncbi:MAG: ABC transporter permease [Saprospiraceae bacterium]
MLPTPIRLLRSRIMSTAFCAITNPPYSHEGSQYASPYNQRCVCCTTPNSKELPTLFLAVMSLVLLLVSVLMTSVSIVREKERGTMEVLLVSPMHPMAVILAKAAPILPYRWSISPLFYYFSFWLLDMPMHGSLLLLYAVSSLFILCSLALGLMISNSTNSQQTAMLVSLLGMLLPTLLLTGFMFPLENMPTFLQVAANIVPSKWFYIIVKAVMIKGVGIGLIWKETLILAAMTVLLLVISFKKFNIRLS